MVPSLWGAMRGWVVISILVIAPFSISCAESPAVTEVLIPYSQPGKPYSLSFGSGLAFDRVDADGTLFFIGVTDRGPGGGGPALDQSGIRAPSFLAGDPDFSPSLVEFSVKDRVGSVVRVVPLRTPSGTPISGRPRPKGALGSTGEVGLTLDLVQIPFDPHGLDPEGVALQPGGDLWISDEYGPFLLKVNRRTGIIEQTLSPGNELSLVLGERTVNRGCEAVTITPSGVMYGALQSVLKRDSGGSSPFIRLFSFDPARGVSRMYRYPIDQSIYKGVEKVKLGDIFAVSERDLLVIEAGEGIAGEEIFRVMGFTLPAEEGELPTLSPRQILSLSELGWKTGKVEGLTLLPDGQTVVISSDSDFGAEVRASIKPEEYTLSENGDGEPALTLEKCDGGKPKCLDKLFQIRFVDAPTKVWFIRLPDKITTYFKATSDVR